MDDEFFDADQTMKSDTVPMTDRTMASILDSSSSSDNEDSSSDSSPPMPMTQESMDAILDSTPEPMDDDESKPALTLPDPDDPMGQDTAPPTPTKPPIGFQPFAMPRPGPSIPVPPPKGPFKLTPSRLEGIQAQATPAAAAAVATAPAAVTTRPAIVLTAQQRQAVALRKAIAETIANATRSKKKIDGDPIKDYLPTRSRRDSKK